MKTTAEILTFLLVLILCGCKTEEKMAERQAETAMAATSSVLSEDGHREQKGQEAILEETLHAQSSDSVVERYRERLVTDSAGRVLLHEVEHSRDTFKGKAQSQALRTGIRQEKTTTRNHEQSRARNDSVYNGGSLKEVTVVEKKPWYRPWLLPLIVILAAAGFIISKVTRK